jgi:hypothetical protein
MFSGNRSLGKNAIIAPRCVPDSHRKPDCCEPVKEVVSRIVWLVISYRWGVAALGMPTAEYGACYFSESLKNK